MPCCQHDRALGGGALVSFPQPAVLLWQLLQMKWCHNCVCMGWAGGLGGGEGDQTSVESNLIDKITTND